MLEGKPSLPTLPDLPIEVASFIGRERELAGITSILSESRLLTLTGAGGCGKTRLALRAAAEVARRFPDGVWTVQLAPLTSSALVPRTVATALGIQRTEGRPLLATLALAIGPRRLLLILDNCEHLIGACARLAETLLRACPHLTILATSREPLRIPGEVTWRVPSLALPGAGPLPPLEKLAQIEAVALFLDRARARRPDFALNTANAPAVAAICQRLDGLPLGIELAAGRMGSLTPEHIATRLDGALQLLEGGGRTLPRHETMRGALDWSHALLSEEERTLFRRLAVFMGGFDAEAAQDVCGGETSVLPMLLALVEKSLVEPRLRERETRYRLLEPVRQYAWARLEEQGEVAEMERRHARSFLTLAEAAEPHLMSGAREPWMARLAEEQDNLRAALAWSRRGTEPGDLEVGLRLCGALAWRWVFQGEASEGLEWIESALAKSERADPAARMKALYFSGELTWLLGQHALARTKLEESAAFWRAHGDRRNLAYALQALAPIAPEPQATALGEESLRLFQEVGDEWGATHAMFSLAILTLLRGDSVAARSQLEAVLGMWRSQADEWGMAQTLNFLGDLARGAGDIETATARYQESLTLLRRQSMTGTIPSLLHNLAYLALRDDRPRQALRLFRESLILFRDQGDQRGLAECLAGLACALVAQRQSERAARMFGAAEALFTAIDAAIWPVNAPDYTRGLALDRERMDARAFTAAWEAGHALSLSEALAEALMEPQEDVSPDEANELGLTHRELEVARLVAQGMTNRQIGATLIITEGTARLHVKHILHKLGFASRARIAAWVMEQGLTKYQSQESEESVESAR